MARTPRQRRVPPQHPRPTRVPKRSKPRAETKAAKAAPEPRQRKPKAPIKVTKTASDAHTTKVPEEKKTKPTFSQKMTFELFDSAIEVLTRLGLQPILCFGGLLGAIREGRMIEWDGDLDLVFDATDMGTKGIENLVQELKKSIKGQVLPRVCKGCQKGFIWDIQLFHSVANPYTGKWDYRNVTYGQICLFPLYRDYRGWWHVKDAKQGDYKGWMFPHSMFDPPLEKTAVLNGRTLIIPNDPEKFLTMQYGNWKVPSKKKSSRKKETYGPLPPTMKLKK